MLIDIRPIRDDEVRILGAEHDFPNPMKHQSRWARQARDDVLYLIAWEDKTPVGHVLLKWGGSLDTPVRRRLQAPCPDLEDLFVRPEYRGKKIGTRLIQAAEALVIDRDYAQIGLSVGVQNRLARALYERLGYAEAGFSEYTISGTYLDRHGNVHRWSETCIYLIKPLDLSNKVTR